MAMEGKTAACTHLSPVGNVAAACCDVWSNESVQNVKLLGGMAPTCYLEQLEYDCRLMNQASGDGHAGVKKLQKWLVDSDSSLDPQAFVLTPESTIAFAKTIVDSADYYQAGRNVALKAVELIRDAHNAGELKLEDREVPFLDIVQNTVESMPDKEDDFIAEIMPELDKSKFVAKDYGLA